ncbi:unnamed protein product [Prunus armeniaca]|uniref:Uncharacterized protein n=1 Tax=Prunus armeniaca TaxID=36596 RepID=A0A6J5VJE3_PRUAR|nr:unnamed protein product [Prunus armeniaca]
MSYMHLRKEHFFVNYYRALINQHLSKHLLTYCKSLSSYFSNQLLLLCRVVIDNIVCSTEIFVAAYHTSTGKALAFTSSSASSHLDSPTQHANSPNSSPALQRSLTSVAASRMKKALRLKSAGSGSKKSLGSGGSGSGPGKPKRVMTVGELMRIQMGISDAMDSRVRRALLRISAAQFNLIKLTMQNVSRMFNFIMVFELHHNLDNPAAAANMMGLPDGETLDNELEVVEGMKLDRGYISPYFITNQNNQKCELENPLIIIHEKKISSINVVVKVLELVLQKQSYDFRSVDNLLLLILLHGRRIEQLGKCARRES